MVHVAQTSVSKIELKKVALGRTATRYRCAQGIHPIIETLKKVGRT
jgi:hypothetical protein